MTGSVAEAEDVVQDAWLRWSRTEEAVDSPAAFPPALSPGSASTG
jgi:RNA polymerase sigma-70 factor (ECF subfamily)